MSDIDPKTLAVIAEQRDVAIARFEQMLVVLRALHATIDPKQFMRATQQWAYREAGALLAEKQR